MKLILLVGVLALWNGQAAATPEDDVVYRQCPAVKEAYSRFVALNDKSVAATNAISDSVDRTIAICKAAGPRIAAIDQVIGELKTCQAGGAIGVQTVLDRTVVMRTFITSGVGRLCQ